MKKYRIIKGLVLFIAVFAVACFFTPFAYGAWTSGLAFGYNFIIGAPSYANLRVEVGLAIWLTRISMAVSIAAVACAVVPLASKDASGYNKRGKFHKSLIVSVGLSVSSALLNLIAMVIGNFDELYTFIGLICIAVFLSPVVLLSFMLKPKRDKTGYAPQPVKSSASNAVSSQAVSRPAEMRTAVEKEGYVQDKPSGRKEVAVNEAEAVQSDVAVTVSCGAEGASESFAEVSKEDVNRAEAVADGGGNVKKESYFKRVKRPISKVEDAKPIMKETKIYLLISAAVLLVFSSIGAFVDAVSIPFSIIGILAFVPTAYFGIMLYAMTRVVRRFKNMHCDKCNAAFVLNENTTWKEVKRVWKDSASQRIAESTLYVTVKITCVCPDCGAVKTFTETLCSGKITVTDNFSKDTVVSTRSLVEDYFNGIIHA